MQFKKGDLVLYKYYNPNHPTKLGIGIVMKDTEHYRTKVHFANAVEYKTRYLLNHSLIHAPK